ncbi:MAG: hypothetical protein ABR541_01450, partial [Candidatus Dormibacteria bacterium]
MRRLVVGIMCVLSLAACGGGQGASPSPTSRASASPSATPIPTATPAPTTAAPTPAATAASTPTAAGGGTAAAGFPACPGGGPSGGEPPASVNGPTGACFAAEILFPAGGASCHPAGGGTYAGTTNCPLYPQLAQRLDQHPLSGPTGGADALCRCQNTYQSVSYGVAGPTADGPTT